MPAQDVCRSNVHDGCKSTGNVMEEDKPVLHGVNIRAASIQTLIHLCVESFGEDGNIIEDSEFPNVMFLMHKWYMPSEELAQYFIDLYPFSSILIYGIT
ncbi:RAS guanyl releasing protein 1 (calcium and DAG-regulated) [Mactra antiquata]